MFFEVRLKWLSKFKQPFQMEAAGFQRYWILTLLTLSYLVGFFVLYYFISYLVGTFLPSYYIPSIFLCVLGTIFFCSLLGLLFYLLKCNQFRLENLDISCLAPQAEIWRGELKTKKNQMKSVSTKNICHQRNWLWRPCLLCQ